MRDMGAALRAAARALGFARVGFASVESLDIDQGRLEGWLQRGHHGEMAYMAGASRAEPRALLAEARSVIVVALPYARGDVVPLRTSRAGSVLTGSIARYARGEDYHLVLKRKLRALADACANITGRAVLARPCVDSAPLLERALAHRAGVGFPGKSTMTIVPGVGTYVLLGELITDLELEPCAPEGSGCGRCTACLDACPTGAFVDAHTLDARRCISYLTIELRGVIPRELRALMGRMVFGCDVCQEVCPFNHSPRPRPAAPELAPRPELTEPDLIALLELSSSSYKRLVRNTALRRVSRVLLQRNAAVALGNSGGREALAPLLRALRTNPNALVRLHCAWSVGQLGYPEARSELLEASRHETDSEVLLEVSWATKRLSETVT